jgi:multidrug efflux pump subunit AcrA (membrane-fusion protein)
MKMIINYKKQIIKAMLITSISVISLTSCSKINEYMDSSSSEELVESEITEDETKPISVNAARVELGEISSSIEVAGTVTTGNPVAIVGEATGTLKNFNLKVGDQVTADEVIGQIDPSRPGMNYKMKDISAPISGTIISVNTKEGSLVSPSSPLAYIQDLNDSSIKANIIEKYISQVKIGQDVEVKFDAFPDMVFKGTVSDLDPTVNTQTRSLGVEIDYEDPEQLVLSGMYAKNTIITQTVDDALLIPSTSVFAKDNSFYVYLITDNKLTKTDITKGLETYDYVQVLSGLEEGDVIVNTKSSLLGEGSFVSIQNEGAF